MAPRNHLSSPRLSFPRLNENHPTILTKAILCSRIFPFFTEIALVTAESFRYGLLNENCVLVSHCAIILPSIRISDNTWMALICFVSFFFQEVADNLTPRWSGPCGCQRFALSSARPLSSNTLGCRSSMPQRTTVIHCK